MQKFVPHRWTLNSCFGAFLSIRCVGIILLLHETQCKMRQTVAINAKVSIKVVSEFYAISTPDPQHWCKNLCNKVMSEFFSTNAPDPHHWIRTIWENLGQFRYYMKLDAKRAKLVQLMPKIVSRSCFRIFRNEYSRSTPLDPKLIFWCVLFDVGPFGTILLLHETRHKTGRNCVINAKVRGTKSRQKFLQRMLPTHIFGP
jgi:hypothetical protein